jgi:hypothetical protein
MTTDTLSNGLLTDAQWKSLSGGPFFKAFGKRADRTLGQGCKNTPSRSATAALVYLLNNPPTWGSELARAIGSGQANLTNLTLPRLEDMGLVEYTSQQNPRGGRPLHVWSLTEKGRDIAILAAVESRAGIHSS